MEDFKGYVSDLGGPSANMYMTGGKDKKICEKCIRPSCLHPSICRNLNTDHSPLLDIYRSADSLPYIKKAFVGSGVRYDLAMAAYNERDKSRNADDYIEQLISRHVSGRLKVAPEHTSDSVLSLMRKPSFSLFKEFNRKFENINKKYGLNQQLIPYFISSHPGCTEADMADLAVETKNLNFKLEQVQDFTPTPMTLATEMFYAGLNPYDHKKIFVAKTPTDKERQRLFFFWYKKEAKQEIIDSLRRLHRNDLISRLYPFSDHSSKSGGRRKKDTRHRK